MANISKRGDSYRITVSCGFDGNGKQIRKYETFKPVLKKGENLEDVLNKEAKRFEEACRNGNVLDTNTRFRDFADRWIRDYAEKQLEPRTVARYEDLLVRVNLAFGNMKLCDIKPHHLLEFYDNLGEEGIRADIKYIPLPVLAEMIQSTGKSLEKLGQEADVAQSVMRSCKHGHNVTLKSAEKVASYFEEPVLELFEKGEDKGLSDKTIREHHVLLSSILSTAVKWQVIFSNPCERVDPPKVEYKESRYLDENEAAQLFEALEGERFKYAGLIQILVYTGMRRAELCGLSWEDVDFINKKIYIHKNSCYTPQKGIYTGKTKTRRSTRTIAISDGAVEVLKDYRDWQNTIKSELGTYWQDSGRICTKDDGRPMHPDTLTGWFGKFVKRKSVPQICLHSLRHTNASLMIAAGTPLKIVADRLGDSVQTASRVYIHQIESADAVVANNIDIMLKKGRDNIDQNRKSD